MMNSKLYTKKQWALFIAGLIAMIIGVSILGFFGIRKINQELKKQKLMRENPVLEIMDLNIKVPVLEGQDQSVLSQGAGHFIGTGDFGKGNYCIAGHSSTIYKEYFNALSDAEIGMEIRLYDYEKNHYDYTVSECFIIKPTDTWILDDFGDTRITIITCTDDGLQRLVVVGLLHQ